MIRRKIMAEQTTSPIELLLVKRWFSFLIHSLLGANDCIVPYTHTLVCFGRRVEIDADFVEDFVALVFWLALMRIRRTMRTLTDRDPRFWLSTCTKISEFYSVVLLPVVLRFYSSM